MIHNKTSFGNVIYTEIILHANKISNNVQISTGLNKQLLSIGDGLLFINNKFQTILI